MQQYQSKSPHFHEKKGDEHIRKMIPESLGCFFLFEQFLSGKVFSHLQQLYRDLDLELLCPTVYPALQDLSGLADETFVNRYRLLQEVEQREMVLADD